MSITSYGWPAIGLVAILIVAVVVFFYYNNRPRDPRRFDQQDPKETGCEKDAETIGDPVPVILPDGTKFGDLHMRYSRRCGTVWGTVFTTGPRPDGYESIIIESYRPEDRASTTFTTSTYDPNPTDGRIWGDMLGMSKETGCVQIIAQIIQNGQYGPLACTQFRADD